MHGETQAERKAFPMRRKFAVSGMNCSACSAHVERDVGALNGVRQVTVNLLSGSMAVDFDETVLTTADIVAAVERGGYGARELRRSEVTVTDAQPQLAEMKRRFWISLGCLIPLMYLAMGHMVGLPLPAAWHEAAYAWIPVLLQLLLTLAVAVVNRRYFTGGWSRLLRREPNMDSLIAVSATAAIGYGVFAFVRILQAAAAGDAALSHHYSMNLYFESAAMILTLITLGKYLETRAKGKTSDAIRRLMDLSPRTAWKWENGEEREVAVSEIAVGDVLAVHPGGAVPVDGELIFGTGLLDQAALTGESMPVDKAEGDPVFAATINRTGYFRMRATRVGEDTTLSQIVALVQDAAGSKAPIAKLADSISRIFVPTVMAIAAVTLIVWLAVGESAEFALSNAMAVLVISCPCALGLATPVAIMVGTGKGAEYGLLIKSAEALETAQAVRTVVLDKTGTVTTGEPRVTDYRVTDGVSEAEFWRLAACLEAPSEHPLAGAVLSEARQHGAEPEDISDFRAVSGRGVTAEDHGVFCLAGNAALMQENGIEVGALSADADRWASEGKTPLYFAAGGHPVGAVAVADTVKPTSGEAIGELRRLHLDVVLLTGDNEVTAQAVAHSLHIDRVIAGVMPQDKEREIRRLQEEGRRVAMVGDGINDAPALMRADVGIAIGAGTDIAIESADIVLTRNDLRDVAATVRLSRAVMRNIRQNLFWAFFYNALGIPLAAGVFYHWLGWTLSPMIGAAAMSLSSVCVVSNALRLRRLRLRQPDVSGESCALSCSRDRKGESHMKQWTVRIDGMHCAHCQASVEKALNALDGVQAKVDLKKKCTSVSAPEGVTGQQLRDAVTAAGFEVVSVRED